MTIAPRPGWRNTVESQGLIFHTANGQPYWDESACYVFTPGEIDRLESATAELQRLYMEAGQYVLDHDRLPEMAIPDRAARLVRDTWESEPPSLYGRFDLAFTGGDEPPKLLEYNADTPTSLLEASVIQWFWMRDVFANADQFNSLHERLLDKWRELVPYLPGKAAHFACVRDSAEDFMTVSYLRDLAEQAGLRTSFLHMDEIGWNDGLARFEDPHGLAMSTIFKLYPWEWMIREEFAPHLDANPQATRWIEPAWKMLWSNKAMLPILWELFPDHPNLLPSFFSAPRDPLNHVRKPIFSREGADVTVVRNGHARRSPTRGYGAEGFIYQDLAPLPSFSGNVPVLGSWVVDHAPAGMGIRESRDLVTDDFSRFVPHVIEGAGTG